MSKTDDKDKTFLTEEEIEQLDDGVDNDEALNEEGAISGEQLDLLKDNQIEEEK